MEQFKFQITEEELLVMVVDDNNHRLWPYPNNPDWYGNVKDCPYNWHDGLKTCRRRLEDHLRKNNFLLVACLELAEKQGFPVL